MKTFRIYWNDGTSRSVSGEDIYSACKKVGITREGLTEAKYWEVITGNDDPTTAQYGYVT